MAETEDTRDLPEVNQPGLGEVRQAAANTASPRPAGIRSDLLAGLNSAISNIPEGLASGILAGVNPIYGLHAGMTGPAVGGLFTSTRLMMIVDTSASALAVGQILSQYPKGAERDNALVLVVLMIGAFQILFGVLHLGRITRFVSYSVMTGFLIGIAVLAVLSQIPTLTGYEPEGGNKITQTINVLFHLNQVNWLSFGLGLLTLLLAIFLPRTRLGKFGTLAAIAIPSLIVVLLGLSSVQTVRSVGEISGALPRPVLPSFTGINFDLISGALAIAVIILVQAAGVSQSVPNPDGSPSSLSKDFIAQGAANLATGFFRGIPVGGALSATAVTLVSGARSRWAVVLAGLWMALIVIVFPGIVAYVAMPALGGLVIYASSHSIKLDEAESIWETGWPSRIAFAATFLATLFLPITAAVAIGTLLSALLYISESSTDVAVIQLVERPDGKMEEHASPKTLPSNRVTVLDVYGHLFYAGARTLERLLPSPDTAQNPAVILRLRGRRSIGATLVEVIDTYSERLDKVGGKLYLTGLSQGVYDQVKRSGKLTLSMPVEAYTATPVIGESTHRAYADATIWLVEHNHEASAPKTLAGERTEEKP